MARRTATVGRAPITRPTFISSQTSMIGTRVKTRNRRSSKVHPLYGAVPASCNTWHLSSRRIHYKARFRRAFSFSCLKKHDDLFKIISVDRRADIDGLEHAVLAFPDHGHLTEDSPFLKESTDSRSRDDITDFHIILAHREFERAQTAPLPFQHPARPGTLDHGRDGTGMVGKKQHP